MVIDSFANSTKSTTTKEVLDKLKSQQKIFGNPVVIVADRGTAFTSDDFERYCTEPNIKHNKITTGLPRANKQVERINSIIIPVLTQLSLKNPFQWYKDVDELQQTLNLTFQRSIDNTPFASLTGLKLRHKNDLKIKELIDKETQKNFEETRESLRKLAKEQILKVQEENSKT